MGNRSHELNRFVARVERNSQPGPHTAEDLDRFIGPQILVKVQDTDRRDNLKIHFALFVKYEQRAGELPLCESGDITYSKVNTRSGP